MVGDACDGGDVALWVDFADVVVLPVCDVDIAGIVLCDASWIAKSREVCGAIDGERKGRPKPIDDQATWFDATYDAVEGVSYNEVAIGGDCEARWFVESRLGPDPDDISSGRRSCDGGDGFVREVHFADGVGIGEIECIAIVCDGKAGRGVDCCCGRGAVLLPLCSVSCDGGNIAIGIDHADPSVASVCDVDGIVVGDDRREVLAKLGCFCGAVLESCFELCPCQGLDIIGCDAPLSDQATEIIIDEQAILCGFVCDATDAVES